MEQSIINLAEKINELVQKAHEDGAQRLVVGAIVLKDGKILVLKRNLNDFMGGIDELPSGKVEDGEDVLKALSRELVEETGLEIRNIEKYVGSFDYTSKSGNNTRQFNFLIIPQDGEVAINPEEHIGYYWISPLDLDKTKLTSNIKMLVEQM